MIYEKIIKTIATIINNKVNNCIFSMVRLAYTVKINIHELVNSQTDKMS